MKLTVGSLVVWKKFHPGGFWTPMAGRVIRVVDGEALVRSTAGGALHYIPEEVSTG